MTGKKRQRALQEDNTDDHKKPKQKDEIKEFQETHHPPPVSVLASAEVTTISRKETNGNVQIAAEKTHRFDTLGSGKEEIHFFTIAREVMTINGNHGSDYETETKTINNAKTPEPTSTSANDFNSHHNANAPRKTTASRSRWSSMSHVVLLSLLIMTCALFGSLWLHEVKEHTLAVQECEQELLQVSQTTKREIQGLKKDLDAWMGRSRQLEQQKRDMGEEFQLCLKMLETKNNEKALEGNF